MADVNELVDELVEGLEEDQEEQTGAARDATDELDDVLDGIEDAPEEQTGAARDAKAEKGKKKKERKPAEPQKLARGRMPAPLVWFIRFMEKGNDSQIAKKFFTTPGKINDIRKNRGFKYITKDTAFSQGDIDSALEKVKKNFTEGTGRGGKVSDTTAEDAEYALECVGKVPVSETSTLESQKAADRKPRGAAKAKEPENGKEAEETKAEAEEVQEEAVSDEDLEALLNEE